MKLEDVILINTRANQPAASDVPIGTLYAVTDEDNIIERSNGTTWDAYSPTGGGGAPDTSTYLTEGNETGTLPNSRAVLAGTGIAFDDTTPGERTISASGGAGGVYLEVDVTLTDAQILALASTSVQLLAAPGNGFAFIPTLLVISSNFSAGAYGSAFTVILDNGNTRITTPTFQTGDRVYSEAVPIISSSRSSINNQPMIVFASIDNTGGNAANEMYIKVIYLLQAILA